MPKSYSYQMENLEDSQHRNPTSTPLEEISTHQPNLHTAPPQRQNQGVRQQAAAHLSHQMGNQAFIRRVVNPALVQRDIDSGAGNPEQERAEVVPTDPSPEEKKRAALKAALAASVPPLKNATTTASNPGDHTQIANSAETVVGYTTAVSGVINEAKSK